MEQRELQHTPQSRRVGFLSTRLAGTDGVSLEADKWASVFAEEGFEIFYFAGELDRPMDRSMLVPYAHFRHPDILDIYQKCFGVFQRSTDLTDKIHDIKNQLKKEIYDFVRKFKIDILVPENALTIPLNIPLGLALTEFISETGITTIAHHHDFFWERQRFLINAVWEYLNMAFPPHLPSIRHVVINSSQDNQLSLRTGISATLIPNVMDYQNPPAKHDDYADDFRAALGIREDQFFILQPTRIILRKGIEYAVELVHLLDRPAKLVISHIAGDEGIEYYERIAYLAKIMQVDVAFASDIIGETRGRTSDGRKIYTLDDLYPHADLVTYPSTFEGFGNAFLETIYYRKPIVVNNYSIFSTDIKPKGFDVIEFDGFINDRTIHHTRRVLDDPDYRHKMVETNYQIADRYYSYHILRCKLRALIADCGL